MADTVRIDGRRWDEPRPVSITVGYQRSAEGSALIEMGGTKVLCAASLEERVPAFLRGQGTGWVTAEYSMLPRATNTRTSRERDTGRVSGRSQEIQRLIGRSLRSVTDMAALGERTVQIDCDVIEADGGTRTASITGAYVALHQAMQMLVRNRVLRRVPLECPVAAVSVGLLSSKLGREDLLLDLCYAEDYEADVDFNVVMTANGGLVELQGATEARPFARPMVEQVLALAARGLEPVFQAQRAALKRV